MPTPSLNLPNLVLPTKHNRNEQELKDTKEQDATNTRKTAANPIYKAINMVLEEATVPCPLKRERKKRNKGK